MNIGLQHEQATVVALIRNIDIVIAYTFDILLFNHSYSTISLLGGVLVAVVSSFPTCYPSYMTKQYNLS